jgi:predicted PurR-regulated permease PerM
MRQALRRACTASKAQDFRSAAEPGLISGIGESIDAVQDRQMSDRDPSTIEAAASSPIAAADAVARAEANALRRDRLLSSLNLLVGAALLLAAPFALRQGAPFFVPLVVSIVIAIVLVPPLEWLERRRVPSGFAALLCVLGFITLATSALAAIVVPATNWLTLLQDRAHHVRTTLAPILNVYSSLRKFADKLGGELIGRRVSVHAPVPVTETTPNSLVDLIALSAPSAIIEMLFGVLLIYFFLSTYTASSQHAILSRGSFSGSLRMARMIRHVVDRTAAYIGTITVINVTVGSVVALVVWLLGMPTPLMWGGLAALFNFVPYLGPMATAGALALGGLVAFDEVYRALAPAAAYLCIHLMEANVLTPRLVGHRLTINPLAILVGLSFWGWVWGTTGALLSVPLLIIIKTLLDDAGRPDIAAFLFEDETIRRAPSEPPLS